MRLIPNRGRTRVHAGLLLAGASLIALGGCNTDELVSVTDPNQLRPSDLTNASSIPALVQGAIRQFVGGYSGLGDDAFVVASGVISDEFYYGDTFTTRNAADSRNLQPTALGNISDAAFVRLQQARINARRAYAQVVNFSTAATASADSVTRSRLRAYEAYVYVTLSEGWCGAVPFSVIPDSGTISPVIPSATPVGTLAMNDSAIVRFDEAIALNKTNYLAQVGKGRALLNQGKYAAAAAAVATVPTSFVQLIEHSTNAGSENNATASLQQNGRYGVANLEGGGTATAAIRPDAGTPAATNALAEGLPFRGTPDPRVPTEYGRNCFSSSVRCYYNDNQPTLDADFAFASGVEARLIEAEAYLQAGKIDSMLVKLNALRASVTSLEAALNPQRKQTVLVAGAPATLAPLVDPASATATPADQFTARRNLLFSERAFWLFGTGHRQGDLRRLVRQYGLTTQQAFPTGPFFRGGTYGNDVAYPIPFNELNNTGYQESACSTTTA